MKTRFSTLDICAVLSEINKRVIGMRVANVYDVDHKTYLFKLAKPDVKAMLLLESGVRIHLSDFDWPKNTMPSGFAMKLRKHLRGRRLVSAVQLGCDRIIDLQFGSDEAAFHVFVELYDRGNIALTDHQDVILNLLRFRKDATSKGDSSNKEENEDVRFAVHEPYPRHAARPVEPLISVDKLKDIFRDAKENSLIKRVLNPHLPYGVACIDHCLAKAGFSANAKLDATFDIETVVEKVHAALAEAEDCTERAKNGLCKGFIMQKQEKKSDGELLANVEFHPFLFDQHKSQPYKEFESFNQAVDEFYGSLESQKNDMKALQRERAALRKLENVRRDHESRLQSLRSEQDDDKRKAWIIENNLDLVDQAIKVICSAIANQVDWNEIKALVYDAQARGDLVASAIKSLKLETNTMVMSLSEPSLSSSDDSDFLSDSEENDTKRKKQKANSKPVKVDIDLSQTAYANAQRYYGKKRQAAQKEQRTMDASAKAFKSAEKKTKQTLKEAAAIQTIQKARRVYWFEKFLWFISSENYLVLGGRDAQQNEILVKKYLRAGDVYVHADLHGATSCIIKNPTGLPVPPKTLNEAGTMAICHSAAWDAKVVTSAWWVHRDQVSKTAPSGEYLTTGSFLIRGKKNFLPPSYLIYGFGFLFKVDETCIWKHKGERKVRSAEDDQSTDVTEATPDMNELDLNSDDDVIDEGERSSDSNKNDVTSPANTEIETTENSASNVEDAQRNAEEAPEKTQSISSEKAKEVVGDEENNESNVHVTKKTIIDFPDTMLKMQYEANLKYDLNSADVEGEQENDDVLYLGDEVPFSVKKNENEKRKEKPRMSAKQRREQKKTRRTQPDVEEEILPTCEDSTLSETIDSKAKTKIEVPPPLKRGQKKKMNKIRGKYKDQDEEDRRAMMELLQGPGKQSKAKERKEKNKHANKKNFQSKEEKPKSLSEKIQDTSSQEGHRRRKNELNIAGDVESDEEREMVLKAEHLHLKEVDDILDGLTGIPAGDDVLLFAIPVCAPYNTMHNYKFKVKLTPGTGKKGKAAKTAIGMFMQSRDTTTQEKDHLRSVKDHDLSKNMPGKVKVSAPNLQKQKTKAKKR